MKNNKFVIIAPFYNCEKTVDQFLASIFYQVYDKNNIKVILLDDLSTDNSLVAVDQFCVKNKLVLRLFCNEENIEGNKLGEENVVYVKNKNKRWEVENVLNGLKLCEYNDIICRIDPDDVLTDLMAFHDLNMLYEKTECDFCHSAHRWTGTEFVKQYRDNVFNIEYYQISQPLPEDNKNKCNVYQSPWVSSHLKTFRKYLLNDVKDENFRIWDGSYGRRAGDQFIILPVLHNSKKRIFFPKCLYLYNIKVQPETFSSEDAKYQRDEAEWLRRRGYIS